SPGGAQTVATAGSAKAGRQTGSASQADAAAQAGFISARASSQSHSDAGRRRYSRTRRCDRSDESVSHTEARCEESICATRFGTQTRSETAIATTADAAEEV